MVERCQWALKNERDQLYHDREWGVPVYDDQMLFEMINLEGQQAGLSWSTVLAKREHYREVFDQFDAEKISVYQQSKLDRLREDPGIIRNKLKIASIVTNAQAFLKLREQFGSFQEYIWSFVEHQPIQNHWKTLGDIPAHTQVSDQMSKSLKKNGFKFVGTTICYAFMQAVGMVNDHVQDCFRYQELQPKV